MKGKLLSVIVPAYNSELYIEQCVLSIVEQEYRYLDIIIVDDGSKDSTGEKADLLARADNRIRVIHQDNAGSLLARKTGVAYAQGEYVTFVDSDDWIDREMYSSMMSRMIENDVDLVTTNRSFYTEEGQHLKDVKSIYSEGVYERDRLEQIILPTMIWDFQANRSGLDPSASNKVFKKGILQKITNTFTENIFLGDDALITYLYAMSINSIEIFDYSGYHYIMHANSVCHTAKDAYFSGIKYFQLKMFKVIKQKGYSADIIAQVNGYVKALVEVACNNYYGIELCNGCEYIFPYEALPKGSCIVLYGAGKVGDSYWRYVSESHYFSHVYWTDTDYRKYRKMGKEIMAPSELTVISFDYIVICVMNGGVAREIQQNLQNLYGISEEKIIWEMPRRI